MKKYVAGLSLLLSSLALSQSLVARQWERARDPLRECGLDPSKIEALTGDIDYPFLVIRHGKLCYRNQKPDWSSELYSASKSFSSVVFGAVAYQLEQLRRPGIRIPKDADLVSDWISDSHLHPATKLGHILGFVGQSVKGPYGPLVFDYDHDGSEQLNLLNEVLKVALNQAPDALGSNLEEFYSRFLKQPLDLRNTSWTWGFPDKMMAVSVSSTVEDLAKVGWLVLNGGVWQGRRMISRQWAYKMTHPAFEEANKNFAYLGWVQSFSTHRGFGFPEKGYLGECMPAAINRAYPHGISRANDCSYANRSLCRQTYDSGVWAWLGAEGQHVTAHPGLDLLVVIKNAGEGDNLFDAPNDLWSAVRKSLVEVQGFSSEKVFCDQYSRGDYVIPSLQRKLYAPVY